MVTFLRLLATLCAFMVVGTVGGMEWGTIAKLDGIIRMVIFMVLTAKFHKYAELLYAKQRKKRRAHRTGTSVNSHKNVA